MAAPVLRIIVEHQVVDEVPLQGDVCLGRAADNDVVLPDHSVSGHHARIERRDGGWRFIDLGSANGSFVAAGPRLRQDQGVALDELTQIKLGDTVLEFRPAEPAGPAMPPEPKASDSSREPAAPAAPEPSRTPAASKPGQPEPAPRSEPPAPEPTGSVPTDPASLHPRVIVVADDEPRSIPVPVPRAVLGRAADCGVVLDASSVSSRHAEIAWVDDGFELTDLDSTNGTRLGLGLLHKPTRLANGSHLILGTLGLLFVHDGPLGGPEGDALDAADLLAWLVQRRKLSPDQARQAMDAHRRDGRSVEEHLVLAGMLGPGALSELRHNAGHRLLGLSDAQRTRLAPAVVWALLAAVALLAMVVALFS